MSGTQFKYSFCCVLPVQSLDGTLPAAQSSSGWWRRGVFVCALMYKPCLQKVLWGNLSKSTVRDCQVAFGLQFWIRYSICSFICLIGTSFPSTIRALLTKNRSLLGYSAKNILFCQYWLPCLSKGNRITSFWWLHSGHYSNSVTLSELTIVSDGCICLVLAL